MTKVSITVHRHTDILSIDIQEVKNFDPKEYLKEFMKTQKQVAKYSIFHTAHNHYKVLLQTDNKPQSVHNTQSLLMVWYDEKNVELQDSPTVSYS